jgi:uncharacterized protein
MSVKTQALVSGVFLVLLTVGTVAAASFDCNKAKSEVEKLLCGDDELSKLDESLNRAYMESLKRTDVREQMIKSQRQWLKRVRNACQTAECLRKVYETRIKELSLMPSPGNMKSTPPGLNPPSSEALLKASKSQATEPPAAGISTKAGLASTGKATGPSPRMCGDLSSPEFSDAFRLAVSMFYSKSTRLYAPLSVPEGINSELVLGASAFDISGGDALEANKEQFEKVSQLGNCSNRSVYWGKHVENGVRIVVKETPFGWRGDMYSLYLLDANVEESDFLKDAQEGKGKSKYSPVVEDTWRPPLVFLSKSNKMWLIVVGEPDEVLADWVVDDLSRGLKPACIIKFQPDGKNAMNLLPKAVQHLVHLLDRTLGSGLDEGTQQPTAYLRIHVQHVWGNAAFRPWALCDSDTYNSTDEVKAGLSAWSQQGPTCRRVYDEILRSYPRAELALADYYLRQFHLPKPKANNLAKWVLDIAFRANYSFSTEHGYFRYDNVNTNPWTDDYKP